MSALLNRILLVDDNEIVNFYNEDLISEYPRIRSVEAYEDAESAMQFIRRAVKQKEVPGIWLVDINLPSADGFEFIDDALNLLDEEEAPNIYMLTTSEHAADKRAYEARKCIRGYLQKPLRIEGFEKILEATM